MGILTRAQIRDLAAVYADQDASDFPTQIQFNTLLDAAGISVWNDLFLANYPFNFSSTTITGNNSSTYPLGLASPAVTVPILSVVGVYFVQGTDFYALKRINEGYRAQLSSSSNVAGYSEYYDVRSDILNFGGGSNSTIIELLPKPSGGQYKIEYIPSFSSFAADGTLWTGPPGSDELVAIKAAIKAVRKEGAARRGDAADLKTDYDELLSKVVELATRLNGRDPAMIRDVSTVRSRFAFDYPIAGPESGSFL